MVSVCLFLFKRVEKSKSDSRPGFSEGALLHASHKGLSRSNDGASISASWLPGPPKLLFGLSLFD